MNGYELLLDPRAEQDVGAAFVWYENERPGLGQEFLAELRAAYERIASGPLGYQTSAPESGGRC